METSLSNTNPWWWQVTEQPLYPLTSDCRATMPRRSTHDMSTIERSLIEDNLINLRSAATSPASSNGNRIPTPTLFTESSFPLLADSHLSISEFWHRETSHKMSIENFYGQNSEFDMLGIYSNEAYGAELRANAMIYPNNVMFPWGI